MALYKGCLPNRDKSKKQQQKMFGRKQWKRKRMRISEEIRWGKGEREERQLQGAVKFKPLGSMRGEKKSRGSCMNSLTKLLM